MDIKKKKYNLPVGYSLFQTTLKSNEFLNNPIKFISKSMDAFSGTYSAALGINKKLIVTQNPEFINYILKENHKNYNKSELATERAVEFFGKGLLFSNGDYWLKQRRLIQPAFHREKLKGLYDIIIKSIDEFLLKFPIGKSIDIYPLVHQLSFNILIQSLFDIKLSSKIMEELSQIFTDLQGFLIKDINQPLQRLFYPFTGKENIQLKKAKRLREIFIGIINERKASDKNYDDLLDMLLKSKYEDTGEGMTTEQIVDEVLILIFAGHETTANTLSWLLYLLSINKDTVQKLTDSFDGSTIHECLNNEYLKATLNEVMRLYPAAWMTERVAIEDDEFDGFSFPKNTIVIPFFFGLHRDKKLWNEELKFDPERFIVDAKVEKSKNYFPFGAGPRMCIGNNFAMAEMSFFIFSFLKKFQIKSTGQIPVMKALITLRPDKVLLNIQNISG
jgi:cytochrome P450